MKTNDTNKKIKKTLPVLILFVFMFMPVFAYAAGLLPNCGIIESGKVIKECGYYDLLELVNKVIDWIIMIAVPVAAGVLAWAGFKYMTTGISDQKSEAKTIIRKVCLGLVFILAAWLIVGTILKALLKDPNSVPVNIAINNPTNFYV